MSNIEIAKLQLEQYRMKLTVKATYINSGAYKTKVGTEKSYMPDDKWTEKELLNEEMKKLQVYADRCDELIEYIIHCQPV